jgi:D-alanyl-D-alanine carboxypeptidase
MTDLGLAYGHGGWTPGYLSIFAYYPVHRAAVALQINELGRYDLAAYVHTLANTLLEGER